MRDDPLEDEFDGIPLVTCTFCNKQVSDSVKQCPYCGRQLIAEWNWLIWMYVVVIAGASYYLFRQ